MYVHRGLLGSQIQGYVMLKVVQEIDRMQKSKGSWAKIGLITVLVCCCLGVFYGLLTFSDDPEIVFKRFSPIFLLFSPFFLFIEAPIGVVIAIVIFLWVKERRNQA
jgi:hypothetical protein